MTRQPLIQMLVLGVLLLAGGGCMGPTTTGADISTLEADLPEVRVDVSAEELRERLAAATQVANLETRDRALELVALDAAASSEVEICLKALREMSGLHFRDDAAAKASLLARREGAIAAGRKIAELIRSLSLRDAVFAALAAGASESKPGGA